MSRPARLVPPCPDVSPTPGRRSRVIGTVVVLAISAVGIWWLLKGRVVDAPVFRFASIERGDLRSTVSATGALSPIKTVLVGTQVSDLDRHLQTKGGVGVGGGARLVQRAHRGDSIDQRTMMPLRESISLKRG